MKPSVESARLAPQNAPASPLRFVTAASLFDGHDAAINIMRRLIQSQGVEVVHLGHNRTVEDVVRAALQEDVDGIALSSYQGGHVEYFKYMIDMLRDQGAGHIRVFGGGGGTITPDEIAELEAYGVERIYHPNDGMKMGLVEMIEDLVARTHKARLPTAMPEERGSNTTVDIARTLSALEDGLVSDASISMLRTQWKGLESKRSRIPVIGITGTGGAGKSSVTDEILNRFMRSMAGIRIAVLAVDPTRRKTGGALLGDRIRVNSIRNDRIFFRSMATRQQHVATSAILNDSIAYLKSLDFDLIIVETAGIGQSDSAIVDLVDFPVYVMTSDFGAASQLEKIDMLDFAELVILNKFDRRGSEDALRDIRKQWKRNRLKFELTDEQVPVYPTIASQFNDPGVSWMFSQLCQRVAEHLGLDLDQWTPELDLSVTEPRAVELIPADRNRYLAEIARQGRQINQAITVQADAASQAQHFHESLKAIEDPLLPDPLALYADEALHEDNGQTDKTLRHLRQRYQEALRSLSSDSVALLLEWPSRYQGVRSDSFSYEVRGKSITGNNYRTTLSNNKVPKIAPPEYRDWGQLLRFLSRENLPGAYPFTAGVFPYRRDGEDPTRMFAGEGTPERTNRRFHYLSKDSAAARLSTAFDSVTLYGEDPHVRPDVYGKIGNSGVSIASLDDMKKLYSGFDLCAPTTSVSMTINGPAPMLLAFFMNTAVDQQVELYLKAEGSWGAAEARIEALYANRQRPRYHGDLPEGNDGLGLAMLGVTGDQLIDSENYQRIRSETLSRVRGTVQADILKEDQAQNTCIFSTQFALRMMGDIQQFFVDHAVRNFYSVSISGYHIAEAGANPITQLAFTLSNGLTMVEYYLSRGMQIDQFAPNLSFFFSNGMDPEYTVIGRVARRIWARAMKERYGASERSQKLKYHIQTSGRSLHAQDIQFNDIRTTLQALYAIFDNCNSLHTNAYDEAVTTPTEESVRRAVAIQLIINRELGLNFCENPLQGSFIVDELTDLVEEAVYREFERLSERGGVLGAMDTMYQRGKIQDESMLYESKKHDGSLPLIGVNTFLAVDGGQSVGAIELIRSTVDEKQQQIDHIDTLKLDGENRTADQLTELQQQAIARENTFSALLEASKTCSLGQMTHALYEVGGEYRRNM